MKIIRFPLNQLLVAKLVKTSLVVCFSSFVITASGTVMAINAESSDASFSIDSIEQQSLTRSRSSYESVLKPLRQAQSNRNGSSYRSQSEVMREVKSRYNGRVVKMSLNESTAMYSVRVLLPNGKIKNISVSARK